MRSTLPTVLGVGLLVALLTGAAASCLSVDNDRTCGEGEPPCYKGEVCVRGTCFEKENAPKLGEDTGPEDTSEPEDTSGDGELPPDDVSDSGMDGETPDADADTGDADGGIDVEWPNGEIPTKCSELKQEYPEAFLSLVRTWRDRRDVGSGAPGTECSNDESCYSGKCTYPSSEANFKTCAHRMFTTGERVEGDFGGLKGADCICQFLAKSEPAEGGVWRAVLTTVEEDVRNDLRIQGTVHYLDNDATRAGKAPGFLETDLESPPTRDRFGNEITSQRGTHFAWTGTLSNDPQDCEGWTSRDDGDTANVGDITGIQQSGGQGWWRYTGGEKGCDESHHLYCIQQ